MGLTACSYLLTWAPLLISLLVFVGSRILFAYRLFLQPGAGEELCFRSFSWLTSNLHPVLPWVGKFFPPRLEDVGVSMEQQRWGRKGLEDSSSSCDQRLGVLTLGSLISGLALLLLLQGLMKREKHTMKTWLFFGSFELLLKVMNLCMGSFLDSLNHLSWVYQ